MVNSPYWGKTLRLQCFWVILFFTLFNFLCISQKIKQRHIVTSLKLQKNGDQN